MNQLSNSIVNIEQFFQETYNAWMSGIMPVPSLNEEAMKLGPIGLMNLYQKDINYFLTNYALLRGEYLVGMNTEEQLIGKRLGCLLTNYRLVQRDYKTKTYHIIPLYNLSSYHASGWWTATLNFHLINGQNLIIRAETYIKIEVVDYFISKREWLNLSDIEKELLADAKIIALSKHEKHIKNAPTNHSFPPKQVSLPPSGHPPKHIFDNGLQASTLQMLASMVQVQMPRFIESNAASELTVTMENRHNIELRDISIDFSHLENFFMVEGKIEVPLLSPGMDLESHVRLKPKYEKGTFIVKVRMLANGVVVEQHYTIKVGGTEIY